MKTARRIIAAALFLLVFFGFWLIIEQFNWIILLAVLVVAGLSYLIIERWDFGESNEA